MKSVVTGGVALASAVQGLPVEQAYEPLPWDAQQLTFAVREPFPTRTSQATLVFGAVTETEPLKLRSRMPDAGVIFSDGMEADFLRFPAGMEAVVRLARVQGQVVV